MRSTAGPALVLLGSGILFGLAAVTGAVIGLAFGERIHAMLPPITADADAIGGAALALGGASAIAGAVHVGLALLLRRRRGALVPAIAVCSVMAVLALSSAVAALVSAAAGTAPAVAMLVAGVCLAVLGGAYAWAALMLLGVRRRTERPN